MLGKVEQFDNKKRYGFISGDDGRRYFVHASNVKTPSGSLEKGYMVSFTATTNNRGYAAVNVNFM